jgi:hypothetical protein
MYTQIYSYLHATCIHAYDQHAHPAVTTSTNSHMHVHIRIHTHTGESAKQLYARMHTQLARAGVDGVKVDSQAITAILGEGRGGGSAFARAFIMEMESSVQKNFGENNCINCMSHRSECLYAYNLTSLVRVSDDFWPGDSASHTVCVCVCVCVCVRVCV